MFGGVLGRRPWLIGGFDSVMVVSLEVVVVQEEKRSKAVKLKCHVVGCDLLAAAARNSF